MDYDSGTCPYLKFNAPRNRGFIISYFGIIFNLSQEPEKEFIYVTAEGLKMSYSEDNEHGPYSAPWDCSMNGNRRPSI